MGTYLGLILSNLKKRGEMKGFLMESSIPANQSNNPSNIFYFDNDLSHYYNDIKLDGSETRINSNTRRLNGYAQSVYSSYHVYQRSVDKSIIFHSGKDALVFISIVKLKAMKLGVLVYAICLMDNHIHMLVRVKDELALYIFVAGYTSLFTRIYNKRHNRRGSLFSTPFGRAFKRTDKYVRNCISYINNNPVEIRKSRNIEEYTWNLFSFRKTSHPHSEALDISKSRKIIRFFVRALKADYKRGHYVSYELLDKIFSKTDKRETSQIQDYILNLYNPIDYSVLDALYGSFEKASLAINSNTGSEHEIIEDDKQR